jgi:arsenate reductase
MDPIMRGHLDHVVNALVNESRGAVEREQISSVVDEAYEEVSEGARIEQFIPILTMRQARLLLTARQRLSEESGTDTDVLLVCGTNAGRSQVAASLLRFYAPGYLDVVSAGQNPAEQTLPEVVAYMREHGVELTDYPKRLRPEFVELADHIVFVGSNDTEVPPDKDTERWPIQHMTGLDRDEMRQAIGEIDDRVRAFIRRVLPDVELPPSIFRRRA